MLLAMWNPNIDLTVVTFFSQTQRQKPVINILVLWLLGELNTEDNKIKPGVMPRAFEV